MDIHFPKSVFVFLLFIFMPAYMHLLRICHGTVGKQQTQMRFQVASRHDISCIMRRIIMKS
jgi:hypothetical protein